jgi:CxxC motif-containing protein (DUF1111 family)
MKIKNIFILASMASMMSLMISCSDDDTPTPSTGNDEETELADEWYAGGKLGTSFNYSASAYQQPTAAVENAGMLYEFKSGEQIFERIFNTNTDGAFGGLGPTYTRTSCVTCHPGYGHGKRIEKYRSNDWGNACLLIVSTKEGETLTSVGVVPHTMAVTPFKPMIDESKVTIDWRSYTDEWGNTFPDGETYSLIYPEVNIPESAIYVPLMIGDRKVDYSELMFTLESSIGIYGTGLLDAIDDDDIKAQYQKESQYGVTLNPAIWNGSDWAALDSDGHPYRFDYALDSSSVQGNASHWEVTNVVRPDFPYNYFSDEYVTASAEDPEVQADFYKYFPDWNLTGNVKNDIKSYLGNKNITPEISAEQVYHLILWQRGLAVPAARNVDTEDFKKGQELFASIGCSACHRPTWTTGNDDNYQDPYKIFTSADRQLPRYPKQKIWPYTDLVQHRLFMVNDLRTGWCRTTPLWGKGLMQKCAGHSDRLHDCRARNTLEAIMWHGSSQSDARWSVENFRKLSKEERDILVKFIDSI